LRASCPAVQRTDCRATERRCRKRSAAAWANLADAMMQEFKRVIAEKNRQ
jgi:hypothetical protein